VTPLAALDPVLRTPRLVLAPLEAADSGELWSFVSDPDLPRFMMWEAHRDRSETEAFIARTVAGRAEGHQVAWGIREDGQLRGTIGLHDITANLAVWRVDRAELGYWIAPAHHGRGLATEAGAAVLRFAFASVGLHKVTVGCISENVGSRRVIEKLGFRFVGERPDHMFRHDRWWGHLYYEMLCSEWLGPARTEEHSG
jgi:RimJ/RimL family protein N-acetyltransferase